ncbi:FecR family protein [Hoeflea sp.]|uniref:FecR family protein n=1 Tax=Hoeflea sp. TaxID=1940281 RepID=UPI003B015629
MTARSSRYLIPAVFALALGIVSFADNAYAQAKVGVSAAVQGSVFVRSGAASDQRRAQVEESILLQDEVLTKRQSALQILLLDESVFTVGENCEMVIDRFVYDPDRRAGEMSGTVLKGAFRFMSGRIGKANPTSVSIKTPSATIGIRGTFVESVIGPEAVKLWDLLGFSTEGADPERAGLYVLRGPGMRTSALTNKGIMTVGNEAGQKTISSPNYAVFVPGPGQPPIGPVKITEEVLAYFNLLLRSRPNGAPFGNDENSGESQSAQDVFNLPGGDFPPLTDDFIDELFDNQFEEEDEPDYPDCYVRSCDDVFD